MTLSELAILAAYFFVLSILAFYGWHRYVMVYWYKRYADHVPGPRPQLDPLPVVTIQLPIFNEMYVVDRLIDAVCRMDYPKELMEIQVLDDSTDETVDVAALAVRRWQNQGFDISYLHRTDRTGFKAGALEAGMNGRRGSLHRDLRRRLRAAGRFPPPRAAAVRRSRRSGWCRPAGATSTPTTPRSRRSSRSCWTAISCSSTAAATAPGASSTSTARPASGAATPSSSRAGGSTTPSPRTST